MLMLFICWGNCIICSIDFATFWVWVSVSSWSYFLKIFIFNWLIALQYLFDFCHTSTWINHRYTCISSLLNLPPTFHPSHPSRLLQSPSLSSLSHIANSHWLSILHMIVWFHATLSICPTFCFLPTVHKCVLYVCVSIAALETGSSAASF